ncbi:S8 family serine peptidase [Bacillus salitolerans]|uniref:S8 family serine peptidase n=1 Tax=Bacillus salitolerans TaxID=1437434 RepID=A0ABW4LVS4_9BACI
MRLNNFSTKLNPPGVLSVGAIDSTNNILTESTTNEFVDIWAPGENIYSLDGSNINKFHGTSVAAPFITSLAVLIQNEWSDINPELIEKLIKEGATKYKGRWGTQNKNIRLVNYKDSLKLCSSTKTR